MGAIKKFFSTSEKPITLQEVKALTPEDREKLGRLAAAELGIAIVAPK